MEKCVGHSFKSLGPSQKTLRLLVSQAGYGPEWNFFPNLTRTVALCYNARHKFLSPIQTDW